MPDYEFACNTCGEVFERAIPFGEDISGVTCPSGHRKVRRKFSAPAILFKGGGWYSSDQRRDSKASAGKID